MTARTENVISLYGVKRQPSPSGIVPPNPKRNALGNITNVSKYIHVDNTL